MKPFISDYIIKGFQRKFYNAYGGVPNSYVPLAVSEIRKLENGVALRNEVQFSKQFPNSFADIYYYDDDFSVKHPTIIYLHGGGYFMGSRTTGDPLASAGGGIAKQNIYLASLGYTVISMDYCLSPQWRFPNQLRQICEGVSFFCSHADEFHLDMEKVVFMGGSAGAVLSAILGAIHTNPEYANEIGVQPSIKPEHLKGLAIDGAPMNMEWMDWGVKTMYRSWMGKHSIHCKEAQLIHVAHWVTADYPACFLTAGSEGCFPEHVQELGRALKEKGVYVDEYYMDPTVTKQPHGYMSKWETDPFAREGMDRMMAFVKKVSE